MRILKEEELVPLRDALEDVQKFIRETERKTKPYYYFQFDNMINNIEICLQSNEQDMHLISEILLRDWLNANHELLGVSACRLFCSSCPEEAEKAYHFVELITEIEVYFEEEMPEEYKEEYNYDFCETFFDSGRSNK